MNINHLREFVYLAETLSFAMTARHFFLGASVLSKHISAMEDELRVRLFDRSGRGVFLTEEGKAFYEDAVTVVDDYDRAVGNLEAHRASSALCLRLGYLRGACQPFLPELVRYMDERHPEVDLDLRCMEYGELIRAHRSHGLDLVISADLNPETADACDFESIYSDRLYIVAAKGHRIAQMKSGASLLDLAEARLLLPEEQAYPGLFQRYESIVGGACDVSSARRYSDIETFYLHIGSGSCVGFSSGHNFQRFGEQAAFVPLLDADTSYTISARWLKGCDARIAAIGHEVGVVCSRFMEGWSDGVLA